MSPDYDRVIAQEQQVLASIKSQSEELVPELKRAAAAYLRDWAIQLLKSYLSEKTELTQGLGAQKTAELKGEFTAFLEALPDRTGRRLDDPQIWLHRVQIPDRALADLSYSYQFEKRAHNAIEAALKELIGPVGGLLGKYGYLKLDSNPDWETGADDVPRFAYKLPIRGVAGYQALDKIRERYKNLLIEYVYASQNLWKAQEAKKAGKAE